MFMNKKALLLDMNGTFMFGEDRFGPSEDFYVYYSKLGGKLSQSTINDVIRNIFDYLNARYADERYRHNFPSVIQALTATSEEVYSDDEKQKIVDTFAYHELGYIPRAYADALYTLKQHFDLAAVIDIWSPKAMWLETFERVGISVVFSVMSFSSDHGIVKPSPKPFEIVLKQLDIDKSEAVVIGDSPRRDLGGARAAGIDCILVEGAQDSHAIRGFPTLLELCNKFKLEALQVGET